jgi:hypothetical protein
LFTPQTSRSTRSACQVPGLPSRRGHRDRRRPPCTLAGVAPERADAWRSSATLLRISVRSALGSPLSPDETPFGPPASGDARQAGLTTLERSRSHNGVRAGARQEPTPVGTRANEHEQPRGASSLTRSPFGVASSAADARARERLPRLGERLA